MHLQAWSKARQIIFFCDKYMRTKKQISIVQKTNPLAKSLTHGKGVT